MLLKQRSGMWFWAAAPGFMVLDGAAWHTYVAIWSMHGVPRIDKNVAAMVTWIFRIEMQPGSHFFTWLDWMHQAPNISGTKRTFITANCQILKHVWYSTKIGHLDALKSKLSLNELANEYGYPFYHVFRQQRREKKTNQFRRITVVPCNTLSRVN